MDLPSLITLCYKKKKERKKNVCGFTIITNTMLQEKKNT